MPFDNQLLLCILSSCSLALEHHFLLLPEVFLVQQFGAEALPLLTVLLMHAD